VFGAWGFSWGVLFRPLGVAGVAPRLFYKVVDTVSFVVHHRRPPVKTPCERVMASLTLRWQPYTYWRGAPSHNDLVTVEADGRRRNWNAAAVDSTARQVWVTGGSAVWGMCVLDDETIPSDVAKRLAATGVRARVENHAQIGWVTSQEGMDLDLDLRAGRVPDVVVFYDGWNDIVAGMAEGRPGIPLNEANREAEF